MYVFLHVHTIISTVTSELITSEKPSSESILSQKMARLKAYILQQESEGGHADLKNLKTMTTAKLYHKLTEINEISGRLDKEEGIDKR